jgi:hypothetical protein
MVKRAIIVSPVRPMGVTIRDPSALAQDPWYLLKWRVCHHQPDCLHRNVKGGLTRVHERRIPGGKSRPSFKPTPSVMIAVTAAR